MNDEDIVIGNQYRWREPDGPIVTVYNKHEHIDNHYYIKFEQRNSVDTTRRELLFPL